jgi:CRP-like cAMP-binding protein
MEIPLFSGIPIEPFKVLAYLCQRRSFQPGEILFAEQEVDPQAYLILEGKARLLMQKNGDAILRRVGEMDFIGGFSLFCDMKRLFTLQAESKVKCLVITREKFQKTLTQFPSAGNKVFERLAWSIYEWESNFISEHVPSCENCKRSLGVSLL